jgi:hypothetical protein
VTNAENSCENCKVPLSESLKIVELEMLEKDLSEFIHLFHIARRPTVKEVIQMDIELTLEKIESIKNINKDQIETKVSWSNVVKSKHRKYNWKENRQRDELPEISNRYNLLYNDPKEDDAPVNTGRLRETNPKHGRMDKKKKERKAMKKKQHKVIIVGDSHARRGAAEVKHLLNNDFEVQGIVKSGSGMELIKETTRAEINQLTSDDIVVVWGGSNDIARNNSNKGIKNMLECVMIANNTNVIVMSAPPRYDLIKDSCVNREVESFNKKLGKRLQRFDKVEVIEVIKERACYTQHGQHLNTRGKEVMAKKIAATIERVLKKKVEPISMKWVNEIATKNQEHQALQEKTKNNLEDKENKGNSTLGGKTSHKHQGIKQESDGVNILDTVSTRTPKRLQRQPLTRNNDFLWSTSTKNRYGE